MPDNYPFTINPWDYLPSPDFISVDEFGHLRVNPAFCAYRYSTLVNWFNHSLNPSMHA